MKFDQAVLNRLRIDLTPQAYLRVTPLKHGSTPLGMGYGETRFASPSNAFKVLYLARTLVTGVAETVVRDRFVAKARRRLTIEEVEAWGVTKVRAISPLSLLDLRTTGLVQLGVATNAVRGKGHGPGRRFSEALYVQAPLIDGILYPSRLTSDLCIAVYDRGQAKLSAGPVRALTSQPELISTLKALNITVIAS